jgi:holo-[acyl-carrier protein] synthase
MESTLVGCDLQPVREVADAVSHFGRRYLDRVYTPREQATLDTGGAAALAARFAAKEAVIKLVGVGDGVDPRTIEVVQGPLGRPRVVLHGEMAAHAERAGVGSIDISLSHTGDTAMAVAVAAVRSEQRVVA